MKARIVIPLLIYLVVTIYGCVFHAWRHHRIGVIYEEARRNDLAMVATHFGTRTFLPWRIHSISGESAGLSPDNRRPMPGMSAARGETILYVNLRLTQPMLHYYEFSIPEDHPRPVDRQPFAPALGIGIPKSTGSSPINPPWRITVVGEQVSLSNGITGENVILQLAEPAPWDDPDQEFNAYMSSAHYADAGNMLFIADLSSVWGYDLEKDSWTKLFDLTNALGRFEVNSIATLIARISVDPQALPLVSTDFISVASGETILSLQDTWCLHIGKRWAVCLNYPVRTNQYGTNTDPLVFTLYDMQNDWESYELVLDDTSRGIYPHNANFEILLIEPE